MSGRTPVSKTGVDWLSTLTSLRISASRVSALPGYPVTARKFARTSDRPWTASIVEIASGTPNTSGSRGLSMSFAVLMPVEGDA